MLTSIYSLISLIYSLISLIYSLISLIYSLISLIYSLISLIYRDIRDIAWLTGLIGCRQMWFENYPQRHYDRCLPPPQHHRQMHLRLHLDLVLSALRLVPAAIGPAHDEVVRPAGRQPGQG